MRVLPFRTSAEQRAAVPALCTHLQAGGLLAYPTETVYGLGCLLQPFALQELAALKQGRSDKAFLLLIAERGHAPGLRWTDGALRLADAFWPGPLTLALQCDASDYPEQVVGPGGTVAVRETGHAGLQLVLRQLAAPITSTSANLPGHPAAQDAEAAHDLLQALDTSASFLLLDGGTLEPSLPSTVVDCSDAVPRLVRPGAIPTELLKRCIHELRT